MVINASYFINRIGTSMERPCDRRFWARMAMWQWRVDWQKANAEGDYNRLHQLSHQWEMIQGI